MVDQKRAFVVDIAPPSPVEVAGRPPVERMRMGLMDAAATVTTLAAGDLNQALSETDAPVVVAPGNWVVDALTQEEAVHRLGECAPDELILFSTEARGDAPIFCVGPMAAACLVQAGDLRVQEGSAALRALLPHAPGVRLRQVTLRRGFWSKIEDDRSAGAAVWGLLKQLQFRPGGVVAKYLNRPISIRISRILMGTPVTANMATAVAFLMGLAGVGCVFIGGYAYTVLGGALLQLNSIIDGVDGELARTRMKTSEFGAYFDSVGDEVVNALLFAAMGYNLSQSTGVAVYLPLGVASGCIAFAYALVHWHCKWKHGLGFYWWFEAFKPRKEVQRSTSLLSYLKKLFWKESYLFLFFILTIFNAHAVLLWVSVPASAAVLALFFIHIVIKRARF